MQPEIEVPTEPIIDDREFNHEMAVQFRLAADLLATQSADPFRVRAYRRAADALESMDEPVSSIYRRGGLPALIAVPTIGRGLALAIADVVEVGHWRWLDHLQGEVNPEKVLSTVAGVGPGLATRIHEELGIESLEELELAANDGRLAELDGFGPKRVQSISDSLAGRLRSRSQGWLAESAELEEPTTEEILSIDDEYREKAALHQLPTISPRRFNPTGARWLPILHTSRGPRHYTAMFSNTARAHELDRTDDWVVIYADAPDHGQWTVVTEMTGPRIGLRSVRGRTDH